MKIYKLSAAEENLDILKVQEGYLNGFSIKNKNVEYKGSIITFGGSEGSPYYNMANKIKKAKPDNTEIVIYHNVGHAFGEKRLSGRYFMGGQDNLNKIALAKSYEKVLDNLYSWHAK